MPDQKIEGTFYIDGLLEGPLLSEGDESLVRTFVKEAAEAGLVFHAAADAARFSLLADTQRVEIRPGEESAEKRVARCLRQFVSGYSSQEYVRLMSTLRSVEFVPGHEVQTLYAIKPDGTVTVQQRTVQADTIRPAPPPDWRQMVKPLAIFVLIVCAAIGISAPFVPYRDLAARLYRQLKPYRAQDLKIDVGPYEPYFSVQAVTLDSGQEVVQITFEVSATYPATEAALNGLWESADSVSQRLAIEALVRNSLQCEFFDWDGQFRGQQLCYMHWSEDDEKLFRITIPLRRYLSEVRIRY